MPVPSSPAGSQPTGGAPEALPHGDGADGPEPVSAADSLAATTAELDAVDTVLGDVEAALARLDAGTYGTCEVCRRPLDDDVLASHPTVTRCEGCAEESRLGADGQPAV